MDRCRHRAGADSTARLRPPPSRGAGRPGRLPIVGVGRVAAGVLEGLLDAGHDPHPASEQRHAPPAGTPPRWPRLVHRSAQALDGIVPEGLADRRPNLVEVDAERLQQLRIARRWPIEDAFERGGHHVGVAREERRHASGRNSRRRRSARSRCSVPTQLWPRRRASASALLNTAIVFSSQRSNTGVLTSSGDGGRGASCGPTGG
jgi:hypothetical protein